MLTKIFQNPSWEEVLVAGSGCQRPTPLVNREITAVGQSARVTRWEGLGTRREQILLKKDEPETKEAQDLTTSLEKIWGIKEHVAQLHKDGVDQIHHAGCSQYK